MNTHSNALACLILLLGLSPALTAQEHSLPFDRTEQREPCAHYNSDKMPLFGDLFHDRLSRRLDRLDRFHRFNRRLDRRHVVGGRFGNQRRFGDRLGLDSLFGRSLGLIGFGHERSGFSRLALVGCRSILVLDLVIVGIELVGVEVDRFLGGRFDIVGERSEAVACAFVFLVDDLFAEFIDLGIVEIVLAEIGQRDAVFVELAGELVLFAKLDRLGVFRSDFIDHEKRLGNPEPSLISFVNRFRPEDARIPESYSVRFSDYDKGINDVDLDGV